MKKYRLNHEVQTIKTGNYRYFYSHVDNCYYGFEEIGDKIIDGLFLDQDISQIAKDLVNEYMVSEEKACKDIRDLVEELLKLKILIEVSNDEDISKW